MCGICGYISFDNFTSEKEKNQIKTICDSLAHRGPDANGIYKDNRIIFGHRRLSIIDISESANQPMISSDGNIVVVFNGEIYNYKELWKLLSPKYKFKTDHSDTEIIINAYKEWGIKCLEKFTGMFAIAIYDKNLKKLFLVRDRLGKKPLYYTQANEGLYFSSEITPFFKAGVLKKTINEEAVYHYLTFLTVNAPNTFYKNVSKLESGHYLEVNESKVNKIKYWDVADYLNTSISDTLEMATNITKGLLEKSMAYRNVSDVPVSVALSGGLDSSLNLYYSHKINPGVKTINVSYSQENEFNESHLARRLSSYYNVDYINREISSDIYEQTINEYLSIQSDMPTGDVVTPLMYFISKIAFENGTKVMLVGEGGDEIGGYPVYLRLQKEFAWFSKLGFAKKFINCFPERYAKRLDYFYKGKYISRRQVFGFTEFEKQKFWKGGWDYNSYAVFTKYEDEIRDDLPDSFLRKVLNTEYKLRLPELILARIDYPSMATSIEARSPFMDHKLIEYSAGLPFDLKMKNGAKTILKRIAKTKLPDFINNSPKVGFGMLLMPFLQDTMPIWFHECLKDDAPVLQFIDLSFLEDLLHRHKKNKKLGYKMWIIFALNKWLKLNIP